MVDKVSVNGPQHAGGCAGHRNRLDGGAAAPHVWTESLPDGSGNGVEVDHVSAHVLAPTGAGDGLGVLCSPSQVAP